MVGLSIYVLTCHCTQKLKGLLLIDLLFAGAVAITTGFTNAGVNTPVWLDNVNCVGTETKLIYCQANGIGEHNCNHIEDAGVTCQTGKSANFHCECS